MADYIDREEMLSAIWNTSAKYNVFFPAIMLDTIKAIPAADVVERKKGEWITGNDNPRTYGRIRAMCSRCGAFALYEMVNVESFKEQLSNFCPNCGASMRKDGDGND